jgi:(R)-2-hydroxyacyl-CoA dehydratese activating ATPase
LLTAGVDVGSLSTDVVIYDGKQICGYYINPTLADGEYAARKALEASLNSCGVDENNLTFIVATGYGRSSLSFADRTITEITCHAVGARVLFPDTATVIDIGGQDSKVIRLAADGRVDDFLMNDKCAAGTGRFLEVMAKALGTNITNLASLSSQDRGDVRISSTCTVFAESEVVALVASGTPREDIIGGLHRSVAQRICGMVSKLSANPPYVMTGGVAKNAGIIKAVEEVLQSRIFIPQEPQIVGALGAAVLAVTGHRQEQISKT